MRIKTFCILIIMGIIAFEFSCISEDSKYSKNHYISTAKITTGLYKEVFEINFGGLMTNGSYSYYLTDSSNFRKYIGSTYDDNERIHCGMLDSDRLVVFRFFYIGERSDIVNRTIYFLSSLKKEGKFE